MAPKPIPSETVGAVAASALNLDTYLEKSVDDICGKYGGIGDSINHCAHFVSHVLKLRIPGAALCSNVGDDDDVVNPHKWKYAERHDGFCVRVNQVFNSCGNRMHYDFQVANGTFLIVATLKDNILTESPLTIGTASKKHIGFLVCNHVYHYSNKSANDKVIKQPVTEFENHYGAHTILLRCDLP
jgi:hypothetical protein